MKIHIKTGPMIEIPVESELSDTVMDVKEKILNEEGIPPYQQHLFHGTKSLPDHLTLYDLNVKEESTINLFVKTEIIQIYIRRLSGRTVPLDVQSNDSIENVKVRIEDKEGIPQNQQRLVFAVRCLEDSRRLSHYNIRNESTVLLILRLIGGG